MVKILSQDGQSLADIYDVEGSIAGIEQLETRELPIVHEMGATVFSERFTTRVFRIPTGDMLQTVTFRQELTTLPETPARLLGLRVITDFTSRIARCAVLVNDPTVSQDFPIWVLDTSTVASETLTMEDAGGSVTVADLLPRPALNLLSPIFVGGSEQQGNMVSNVALVGLTTTFGAGDVEVIALLYLAFPRRDINISSKGLPIPSW